MVARSSRWSRNWKSASPANEASRGRCESAPKRVFLVPRRIATVTRVDGTRITNRPKLMARKPNYEFERRERARLKAIKNAEKAAAKAEAKERARAEAAGAVAPGEADSDEKA
jgi:hypothetical protein